jgi:hypothetical protein
MSPTTSAANGGGITAELRASRPGPESRRGGVPQTFPRRALARRWLYPRVPNVRRHVHGLGVDHENDRR